MCTVIASGWIAFSDCAGHLAHRQQPQLGNDPIANLHPLPPTLLLSSVNTKDGRNRGLVTLTLTGKGDAPGLRLFITSAWHM